jgi:hypothetical protein
VRCRRLIPCQPRSAARLQRNRRREPTVRLGLLSAPVDETLLPRSVLSFFVHGSGTHAVPVLFLTVQCSEKILKSIMGA